MCQAVFYQGTWEPGQVPTEAAFWSTVLTLTMVGIGADSRLIGGSGSKLGKRLTSILAMFVGAMIGAVLILYSSYVYPLATALAIIAIIAIAARVLSTKNPFWIYPA